MERARSPRRKRNWAIGLGLAAIGVGAALYFARPDDPTSLRATIDLRFPDTHWIDGVTLAQRMADLAAQPVVLDVREPAEFAVSHLRGARRVDPELVDVGALHLDPDVPVVVYCSVGYRSAAIIPRLRAAGVHDVRNLVGGIFQWATDGRPLYRGESRVSVVHPYDTMWGTLLRPELRAEVPRPPEAP